MIYINLPQQKISNKERIKDDFDNVKRTITYYVNNAEFGKKHYDMARRLANGVVDMNDYEHIIKQYKRAKLKNFKGEVRNIPLIEPILTLLSGEKRKAPFNYNTKINNQDTKNRYLEDLKRKISENNEQALINKMNEGGLPTGLDSKPVQAPEDIKAKHDRNWKDSRAIAGQEILNDFIDNKDGKEIFIAAYKDDWIELGEAYLFFDVVNDDVIIDKEIPENVYVKYNTNSPYSEDGEVVVRRMTWNISQFIYKFERELSRQIINGMSALDWLNDLLELHNDNAIGNSSDNETVRRLKSEVWEDKKDEYNKDGLTNFTTALITGDIEVYYVAFKTYKKYKLLTYINDLGQIVEKEVDETYKLNSDVKITRKQLEGMDDDTYNMFIQNNINNDLFTEVMWTNEVWQGYKVPAAYGISESKDSSDKSYQNDLYLDIKPLDVQRHELNNNAACKLPVIGRQDGYSIPYMLREFQYKYNLLFLIEERTLAKDKGNPILFPVDLIPNIASWGNTAGDRLETMLYYNDMFNVIFFDGSNERVSVLAQAMKSVNMSTIETIANFMQIKEQVKQDAWDSIGMNRNRWGTTYASEGKAKNEQDILRSSLHTADMNSIFNKVEERGLLAYLDYSKYAFVTGKVITKFPKYDDHILSDEARSIYELDVDEHIETQYGVSVKSSEKDTDAIQIIRQLVLPYAQNGIAPDAVLGAVQTDNPVVAKDYLKQAFKAQQDYEKQKEEAQNKLQQQAMQSQQQMQDKQQQFEQAIEQAKLDNAKYIAELKAETDRMKIGNDNINPNDNSEDIQLKRDKLDLDRTKMNKDIEIKNKKIKSDEKIAKLNIQNRNNNSSNK
jgi:hypothetical protein